jgi:hypothetical protein
METTLTFRLPKKQRAKLRLKATALGKSESEFIRDLLDRELCDRSLGEKAGHLSGFLQLSDKDAGGWEKHLRDQNWRS